LGKLDPDRKSYGSATLVKIYILQFFKDQYMAAGCGAGAADAKRLPLVTMSSEDFALFISIFVVIDNFEPKRQCHAIFDPRFFRQSITPRFQINIIKYFCILPLSISPRYSNGGIKQKWWNHFIFLTAK
jgi:hypothetical protein